MQPDPRDVGAGRGRTISAIRGRTSSVEYASPSRSENSAIASYRVARRPYTRRRASRFTGRNVKTSTRATTATAGRDPGDEELSLGGDGARRAEERERREQEAEEAEQEHEEDHQDDVHDGLLHHDAHVVEAEGEDGGGGRDRDPDQDPEPVDEDRQHDRDPRPLRTSGSERRSPARASRRIRHRRRSSPTSSRSGLSLLRGSKTGSEARALTRPANAAATTSDEPDGERCARSRGARTAHPGGTSGDVPLYFSDLADHAEDDERRRRGDGRRRARRAIGAIEDDRRGRSGGRAGAPRAGPRPAEEADPSGCRGARERAETRPRRRARPARRRCPNIHSDEREPHRAEQPSDRVLGTPARDEATDDAVDRRRESEQDDEGSSDGRSISDHRPGRSIQSSGHARSTDRGPPGGRSSLHAANRDSRARGFQEGSPVPSPGSNLTPEGVLPHPISCGGGRLEAPTAGTLP